MDHHLDIHRRNGQSVLQKQCGNDPEHGEHDDRNVDVEEYGVASADLLHERTDICRPPTAEGHFKDRPSCPRGRAIVTIDPSPRLFVNPIIGQGGVQRLGQEEGAHEHHNVQDHHGLHQREEARHHRRHQDPQAGEDLKGAHDPQGADDPNDTEESKCEQVGAPLHHRKDPRVQDAQDDDDGVKDVELAHATVGVKELGPEDEHLYAQLHHEESCEATGCDG
mmetsp:Transcript_127467/g.356941  ORF Transcript_127467/g.356941 Transcript_127467/m.356941 type:complete len:222 (-) Transcript_127467:492-1157(-)